MRRPGSATVVLSASSLEPSLSALAAGLLLDLIYGEPPNSVHPVVWMGRIGSWLARLAPREQALGQLLCGAGIAVIVPTGFALASAYLLSTQAAGPVFEFLITAMLLKCTFALRALGGAAARVRDALDAGQLGDARHHLRSLCSRDASTLEEPLLVAGTVESLAENASDSFVAPLFYYAVLGLAGAVFYRAVNTLDAMIGYRGEYEYLGKATARLDDALNFIPARLTALVLLAAGWLFGEDARGGWRVLRRDGWKTESPNAGRPMAVMAGLLRVRLEKQGHYCLGDPINELDCPSIGAAWDVIRLAAAIAAALVAVVIGARHAYVG